MRIDRAKFAEVPSWVLVVCTLSMMFLVGRREFLPGPADSAAAVNSQATYLEGWEAALAGGLRSGSDGAPVQVIEFADFQCPYCAGFESTVRTIRDKYPAQVAFTFTNLPLPQHGFAEPAARAAECAHAQGRFESMRSLLFEKQQEFGSTPWIAFASQAGISDLERFDTCVNDKRPSERIEQGKRLAAMFNVQGTPTIIVNGWKMPTPPSPDQFDTMIENVLKGRSPLGT